MARYECDVCGHVVDEQADGPWEQLPADWRCPVCESGKELFNPAGGQDADGAGAAPPADGPGAEAFARASDEFETHMAAIGEMAETGLSIIEPMRTRLPVVGWDEILIKGAQLARLPLNDDVPVDTETVIGPAAARPLVIQTPIYVTHMSFGALSREIKIALARGAAAVKTAMCSGEGGILPESMEAAYKYIFEYVPNRYSVTEENLRRADAIEIKIGQSAKPGMGGHLPGEKVTEEIAAIRGKPPGRDVHSPAHFEDITTPDDLKRTVERLREMSGGAPIGVKLAAGNVEADLGVVLHAGADFVTLDGRGGGTGAAPKFIKDATSVPAIYALNRAQAFLDAADAPAVSLVITGGLRVSSDIAKALAMGADAVALGTAAMMAAACRQYRVCHTGKCPVGCATQDPQLRARLKVDRASERVANFLRVCTEELRMFARLTGRDSVHNLSIEDLCTTSSEISAHTRIEHA